jgi:hypothetical protein
VGGPHIPTPLEQLGTRPFSFYPSIAGFEHNEWRLRRSATDEFQVVNTKSNEEVWIPRRFLSGVSSIEEPIVIVGLVKELEYQSGVIVPLVRRVIEMPHAVNDIPWRNALPTDPGHRAPVIAIRLESEPETRKGRTWLARIAAGVLACVVGLIAFRDGPMGARARFFSPAPRAALPFSAKDDYLSIVSRIGRPSWEGSVPSFDRAGDGTEYHLLRYPERGYVLVLLGASRSSARYIGAFGRSGRVIHSILLTNGQDSSATLNALRGIMPKH